MQCERGEMRGRNVVCETEQSDSTSGLGYYIGVSKSMERHALPIAKENMPIKSVIFMLI